MRASKNLSHYLRKLSGAVRAVAITAGLALVAGLGATSAHAADKAPTAAETTAKAMADAPSIIAAAKVNCDLANATIVGPTEPEVNGKKVKANIYELACKTGPGFIVTVFSPTEAGEPFTCNYLVKIKAIDPKSPSCILPENLPESKWMIPVVKTFLPDCELTQWRLIGSTSTAPLIDRYEIGCKASQGGVIDYPQLTATGVPEYKNCLAMEGSKSACTFTTKDQIVAAMKPLATQANPACQVNNVRFVGVTKENDGIYYEFGCANPPGFMVLAKTDGTFIRNIPCASAAGLGGCQYTDAGVAAADANGRMTQTLKAAGFTCTVKDYTVVGTQEATKRDYIEFKCPEQPFGLIGFVPQEGSTAAARLNDCFADQAGRKSCTMVTPDDLMKQVDVIVKKAEPNKGCDVKQVRYIGESAGVDGGIIIEAACVNKRGYLGVISADRQSLTEVVPCTIAKAHHDDQQCEIEGNGTYTGGE